MILDLYEVKGVLGEGGMGKVYRVHHRGWNVDLAVKSPGGTVFSSSEARDNFAREAETWVNLGLHPHIVACYYVRTLGGIPRIFAEHLADGSLSDWIGSRKLYEGGPEKALQRILDSAIQFAWGLDYAHQQGLVHQDVKPANVMMAAHHGPKVSDFGLAQARARAGAGSATAAPGHSVLVPGAGFMTREYCSPEQARGEPLSRKTDIWSWGLSVLEMFSTERTWATGLAAPDVLEEYIETRLEDDGIPRMPLGLAELLRRCFDRDTQGRPATMADVAATVQQVYAKEVGRYWREAPRAAPSTADSLNNRACSVWDLGRQQEAVDLWQEALRLQPSHPAATYNRGLVLWRLARSDDARLLQHLRSPAEIPDWITHYLLALVHLERGDRKAAHAELEMIEAGGPESTEVRFVLAGANEDVPTSSGLVHSFEGHLDSVRCVDLSSEGRQALSGGDDRTVRLWDVQSGRCLSILEGHLDRVSSVTFSADTRYCVSGSADKTAQVWDLQTGRCVRTFKGHSERVNAAAFSRDGRHVVSASDDATLMLWEVETGRLVRTFRGHSDSVTSVQWSGDDAHALSGGKDRTARLWDVRTGRCVRALDGHPSGIRSVALHTATTHGLSGCDDGVMRLWDMGTGRCLRTFEAHTGSVSATDLSADGRYALSAGVDGSLKLWDVATGRCLCSFEGQGTVSAARLAPSGRYVLSAGDTLRLWQFDTDNRWRSPLVVCRPWRVSANSLRVRADDSQTEIMVKRGAELPASGRCNFLTTKGIRKGNREDVFSIAVYEGVAHFLGGEESREDCNLYLGDLVIRGSDEAVNIDLPAGSEIEVTVGMDRSGAITATAYVPALDEEFEATFDPESCPRDLDALAARLETCIAAIGRLRERQQALPDTEQMLSVLERRGVIAAIRAEIARARAGEQLAGYRALRYTLQLAGTLAAIERSLGSREG